MARMLSLSELPPSRRVQLRVALDTDTVAEYAEQMAAGTVFPPVVVFKNGVGYWLAAGNHRVAAAEKNGATEIYADIQDGSEDDAVLYAAASNKAHGQRRTNSDKRRDVEAVLKRRPEWSDRKIADHAGVSNNFVSQLRGEVSSDDSSTPRVGKDGKKRKASTKKKTKPKKDEVNTNGGKAAKWDTDPETGEVFCEECGATECVCRAQRKLDLPSLGLERIGEAEVSDLIEQLVDSCISRLDRTQLTFLRHKLSMLMKRVANAEQTARPDA